MKRRVAIVNAAATRGVAVSAGIGIEAGTCAVRLPCFAGSPSIQFHRGNLTVSTAPR